MTKQNKERHEVLYFEPKNPYQTMQAIHFLTMKEVEYYLDREDIGKDKFYINKEQFKKNDMDNTFKHAGLKVSVTFVNDEIYDKLQKDV